MLASLERIQPDFQETIDAFCKRRRKRASLLQEHMCKVSAQCAKRFCKCDQHLSPAKYSTCDQHKTCSNDSGFGTGLDAELNLEQHTAGSARALKLPEQQSVIISFEFSNLHLILSPFLFIFVLPSVYTYVSWTVRVSSQINKQQGFVCAADPLRCTVCRQHFVMFGELLTYT